ncbi:unnamed protein product [Staurois parvus]|uniref:Uncharacterized protein n=1 Tax=Staurois parvus TaxID=386267 RepID=A0ABN9H655_9NEOB|nr:unnamed protein product [Staurois parvus]
MNKSLTQNKERSISIVYKTVDFCEGTFPSLRKGMWLLPCEISDVWKD